MEFLTEKDKVWLKVAETIATLSKDQNTKVGCVIVDRGGRVVSTGYNGSIKGADDYKIPYSREPKDLILKEFDCKNVKSKFTKLTTNKYKFMLHSEENCILAVDDRSRLKEATIYVTAPPCSHCALLIAQSGIKRIVHGSQKINMINEEDLNISKYIYALAGILVVTEDGCKSYSTNTL